MATVNMKATKAFRLPSGGGRRGDKVRLGRTFQAPNEAFATYAEKNGMAVREAGQQDQTKAKTATNQAAESGPTASTGGRTGGARPASSSRQGQAPAKSTSRASGAASK
jgi:hypothetical protein